MMRDNPSPLGADRIDGIGQSLFGKHERRPQHFRRLGFADQSKYFLDRSGRDQKDPGIALQWPRPMLKREVSKITQLPHVAKRALAKLGDLLDVGLDLRRRLELEFRRRRFHAMRMSAQKLGRIDQ